MKLSKILKIFIYISFYPFLIFSALFFLLSRVPIFFIYRKCIFLYLKLKHGYKFKGFIEGIDALFANSETPEKAKSTVNALFYVEIKMTDFEPKITASKILTNTKNRVRHAALMEDCKIPTLFYQHCRAFGYNFWIDDEVAMIENYIRPWEIEVEEEFITMKKLTQSLGKIMNQDFQNFNKRTWEVLVGSKPLASNNVVKFPVFFRMSHALGDASILGRILTEAFADNPKELNPAWMRSYPRKQSLFHIVAEVIMFLVECILIPHVLIVKILRWKDHTSLNPKVLNGTKNLTWIQDGKTSFQAYENLKQIMKRFPADRPEDIMAIIASQGIQAYFDTRPEVMPDQLKVAFVQFSKLPVGDLELRNACLISQIQLPLENISIGERSENLYYALKNFKRELPSSRMLKIQNRATSLLATYFPSLFFWIVKEKSTLEFCMSPMITDNITVGGYEWKNMTTWTTHGRYNAVNIHVGIHNGSLQIGIIADTAAINSEYEINLILDTMIKELGELRESLK